MDFPTLKVMMVTAYGDENNYQNSSFLWSIVILLQNLLIFQYSEGENFQAYQQGINPKF